MGSNTFKAFFKKILVDFFFCLSDLLKSSVKLVINFEETSCNSLFNIGALSVELCKFT